METQVGHKQLSKDDRAKINQQVHEDLINHLYQGCLPGTFSGITASIALFLDFYNFTPTRFLVAWVIVFNLMMISLSLLYFVYMRFQEKFSLATWEWAYSGMMCACAFSWVPCIYLLPSDMTRQYIALVALFLATTGYSTGTIGQFKLCLTTLCIILLPLIVWCFYKGGLFYNIIGVYSLIYMVFLSGANLRSTKWFKESLKLKLENTLVSYQANHDLLTDLPNQRVLPELIESAINQVNGTDLTFAMANFSLNRMELINDSLGHAAGDKIIQSVAQRFKTLSHRANKNKSDTQYIITISRKDTFNIILLPLHWEEVNEKLQYLFSILDEPFYLEEKGVKLTGSIGVSVYQNDSNNLEALLIHADAAMLHAKRFGGNSLEYYRAEINAEAPKQLELETDLYNALHHHELQVYYQPLINLNTGQISGMEALLRWMHPVHGFISPLNFIPIAEKSGLIIPIGEFVLREACKQTRIWHQMGYDKLKVAVNLAEKQLRNESILDTIEEVLKDTQFDRQYLELEITETAILDESVIPILQKFKQLGLSLAIDDFGTGYSGLSYLKRFSIDKLKIDQSFIKDIPANNDSLTIVSAILAMGRELKVATLAEGVETEEQLRFLMEKKCDFAQGYYFSKPLEASYFTQLLLNYRGIPELKEPTT